VEVTVIVVGAGHAGLEAAFAAARLGAKVILITGNAATIGQTPCNPSVGGVAKGHLVHEIEALGGFMGRAADACAIHGKILNTSKGPAVRSTRVQVDKELYHRFAAQAVREHPGIQLVEGLVVEIVVRASDRAASRVAFAQDTGHEAAHQFESVRLADGRTIAADAVVVTTGTFLGGVLHVGHETTPGGRVGEAPALGLSNNLLALGFRLSRLKTGTPPRLLAGSIDLARFEVQASDEPFPRFTAPDEPEQPRRLPHVVCHMAHTTQATHDVILAHLHESPMYSGKIRGIGPRYCPSIEDKIVRFPQRIEHLVFLEPEGLESDWIYPNGISTSLPHVVQEKIVHSMPGLERAQIVRTGYAVEYDAVDARQLTHALGAKDYHGIYFAGQINGTSGYEEAGAQGLLAGANAALFAKCCPMWTLARDEAYLGVLVDDLVTQGCDEPYRMFTSRAEFRLILREDNASERLSALAHGCGLIDDARRTRDLRRLEAIDQAELALSKGEAEDERFAATVWAAASARRVYAGYIDRQRQEAKRLEGDGFPLAPNLDYASISGLGSEAAARLASVRPTNTSQAARIPGMTPGALACLWAHARNELRREQSVRKKADREKRMSEMQSRLGDSPNHSEV
jgi:tRNA uridine 5-carboxymethylaminomethyl modification enzyme